jgi:hypothetical protein
MRGKKEEHRHDRRAQRPRENMTAQRGTGDAYRDPTLSRDSLYSGAVQRGTGDAYRDPTLSRDSLYSGAVGDPVANFAA